MSSTDQLASTSPQPFRMTASRAVENAKQSSEAVLSDASSAMSKAAENPKQATSDFLHTPFMRAALPFINGGLAGMTATTVIQPVDMIKVRSSACRRGRKDRAKTDAVNGVERHPCPGQGHGSVHGLECRPFTSSRLHDRTSWLLRHIYEETKC